MSEENLKNFTYIASERQSLDLLAFRQETPGFGGGNTPFGSEISESQEASHEDHPSKRRLRSYKTDENEYIFDMGINSGAKPDSNCISR